MLAESFGNAETYDPFTRTFTMTANLPVLRSGEVVAQLPGVVILIGGWSSATNAAVDVIETFQESTQLFQTTGHLMTRRNGHTATTISQRKILITGGFHEPDNEAMASAEIYELPPRPGRNRAVRN